MVIGILIILLLATLVVCVIFDKTFKINITHNYNYNTKQPQGDMPKQLTDDEIKEQKRDAADGLVETLNKFLNGDDTNG